MKNKIVLLLFMAVFASVRAEKPKHVDIPLVSDFKPYHDFRLGIGAVMYENFEMSDMYYQSSNYKIIDFNSSTFYKGMVYTNGIFSANYTYQINPLVGFGITASYTSFYNDLFDAENDFKIGTGVRNRFAFYPQIRFSWLKFRGLKFYSEAGLGLGYTMDTEDLYGTKKSMLTQFVSGQVTFIGVSFGEKIYVYSTVLGVGNSGYVGLGLGYRLKNIR